ncbi:MAG: hypothetical protein LBH43_05410 [Treponema sp.]|jgi:hypothetical protein|nr:hypothetical protein [Treponema sp.]
MKDRVQYAINDNEFIIEDYNNAKAFASFLPAIAGLWGKPLWVNYVNRGQAVSSFGVQDKDGAMTEFNAANKAWRITAAQGFRTFYKTGAAFYEPFRCAPDLTAKLITQIMYIKAHSVRLLDRNEEMGIETEATFCTLPGENFAALLRRISIKNISPEPLEIECIDGLPILHPFGTRNNMLKNMSNLGEGWFAGVNFTQNGVPYYKLPVEALNKPEVVPLAGAHFYCAQVLDSIPPARHPLYCIDPDTVFGEQRDYAFPDLFLRHDSPFSVNANFTGKNKTPSAMGYFSLVLQPGGQAVCYSMIGHCTDYNNIDDAASLLLRKGFFETKEKENEALMDSIASRMCTESAYKEFDKYCAQTFIDNSLRGGFPITIGKDSPYYAYSRVHGDMEREYNFFVVLSEYFSQGNGNYRDIHQNRRSDVFFNRNVGDSNIHFFMNLIQTDGFNPLVVMGIRFSFETEEGKRNFIANVSHNAQNPEEHPDFIEKLAAYIGTSVTIGGLFNFIEDNKIALSKREAVVESLLSHTKKTGLAEHGEGFWSDHWFYNTDLIENYLAIFPDRFKELFLDRGDYIFYDDIYFVEPRSVKYILFRGKPRQIGAVRRDPEKAALISSRSKQPNAVRTNFGKGDIYYTNLLCKLLSLIANKYASLDPDCLGMEMEADKPNWCDALNGLPGIFGSSCAESLELLRLVKMLNTRLAGIAGDTLVCLPQEISAMLGELVTITQTTADDFQFWEKTHTLKENFRKKTRLGISGTEENLTLSEILKIIAVFEKKLEDCLAKLERCSGNGIVPTYFAFVPESFSENKTGAALLEEKGPPITVHSFKRSALPLFLEGPVHYLRLCPERQVAENLHRNMLASPLYDKKLQMFKINAPVADVGQDIGRITVFTPGWLENESIWLHMEYKYLLELLRNDLAREFFSIAKNALVPFFDPAVYGRSIFENSSFIVSSAHPEEAIHGRGFVSRLSGATAEFISIWTAITSGLVPFSVCEGKLRLTLKPLIPADFFTAANTFTFRFLDSCTVVYHNEKRKDSFGSDAAVVRSYRITYADGSVEEVEGAFLPETAALAVREGKAERIDVELY